MANAQEIIVGARIAERALEKATSSLAPGLAERFTAAIPEVFGNATKGARGLEKSGADVPQLFDHSKVNLDELLPFEKRQALAMRAPTFSVERASKFKKDMESVIGAEDQTLTSTFDNMIAAQRANGWDSMPYTDAMMGTRQWQAFNDALWKAHGRLKPVIENLADDLHIPRPKFQISHHERGSASFSPEYNEINMSATSLVKSFAETPSTAYHELTHAEQTNLVVRRAADKLGIGLTADTTQLGALLKSVKEETGITISDSNYLLESLRLRNGMHLTSQQLQRADELANSFRSFKSRDSDVFGNTERRHAHEMIKILKASNDEPLAELMSNRGLARELSGKGYWFGPQGASAEAKSIAADWQFTGSKPFSAEQERTAMEHIRRILGKRIDEVNANEMTRFVNYRTSLHEVEAYEAGDQIGATAVLKLIAQKNKVVPTIPTIPTYTALQAARQAA
ncbi:hypothetical protein KBI23_12180 [bacterium]|nr:hypothetical protein [bacterium]MBP9810717.1 hypothetical protein [bacterium]